MDCRSATALLETARPASDDLWDAEFAAAIEHVESCARCLAILRKREEADRRVGEAMRDVPVPPGLEARALARLADVELARNAAPVSEAAAYTGSAVESQRPLRRTRMKLVLTAASVLLLVGAAMWGYLSRPTTLVTIDLIQAELSRVQNPDWSDLDAFNGDEALTGSVALPSPAWTNGPIWLIPNPNGLPKLASRHTMALYAFQAMLGRDRSVHGLLVITSRRAFANPPQAEALNGAPLCYVTSAGREYSLTAWTSGDLVYVCGIETAGGVDNLEAFQQLLEGPPA